MDTLTQVQILVKAICILYSAKTLEKSMNPIDSLVMSEQYARRGCLTLLSTGHSYIANNIKKGMHTTTLLPAIVK